MISFFYTVSKFYDIFLSVLLKFTENSDGERANFDKNKEVKKVILVSLEVYS